MNNNTEITYQTQHQVDHNFNGTQIRQRVDGYLDATAMCRATGKQWKHYNENANSKAFVLALSSEVGIPTSKLIQSVRGGNPQSQGTWIHPQVAIHLAQWCSPKFAVMITEWIFELMTTGRVELQPEPTTNPLEGEILLAKAAADMLRMSDDSKLKMLYQISDEHNLSTGYLPQYVEDDETKALTTLLKKAGSKVSGIAANKILLELGILEEKQRPSTSKGVKKFKSLTDEGLFYGKNLVSPNNPRETSPHYYVSKFQDLLDRIDSFLRGDTVMEGVA